MKARLLADVHFDVHVCERLRAIGYAIVEARLFRGQKHCNRMSDQDILAFALSRRIPVLTDNVSDFRKLHKSMPWHEGIVACREYDNFEKKANRIHSLLERHMLRNGRHTGKWMRLRSEFRKAPSQ
jgi:hypothetical protein